ncbi:alpha-ketoglutarate-dependent dioxygenase AlkB [Limnoglobus roseus]|nr:alpha-ketoglutarate-dependent dioxygenase AlkB [Limnoglobus roseus]
MDQKPFRTYELGGGLAFLTGRLPAFLVWTPQLFVEAWQLHPEARPTIFLHGRHVTIPRWQQAYGADYHFSGQTSHAEPVPAILEPILRWATEAVHPQLNGVLLNWYDGPDQYIGPHRDSVKNMIKGVPIVTISFGETRTFRLSLGGERRDFPAENGTVFVIPQETNRVWKHAVPKSTRYTGRRISVTIRGFARP